MTATAVAEPLQRTVRVIMPTKVAVEEKSYKQLRTAAYCRVSTDSDEQELSFEAQVEAYTDKIMRNPDWTTRRLIDCIKVMSKNELLIIFKGGIKKTITI